jgi:hypothetical protein
MAYECLPRSGLKLSDQWCNYFHVMEVILRIVGCSFTFQLVSLFE